MNGTEYDITYLWRKLLWFRHGCPSNALYGDDGEMQCHTCNLDFRRMTAEQIEQQWMDKNTKLLIELQSRLLAPEPTKEPK